MFVFFFFLKGKTACTFKKYFSHIKFLSDLQSLYTSSSTNIEFLFYMRWLDNKWFPANLVFMWETYCGYICGRQLCWLCQSRVCLSVLFSDGWCGWSELEITNSSFLSTSSSVPPFLRAPWMALRSSSFSCRLSRMKPGMQIIKEIVRRLRVRPRYAILRGTKKIDLMKISKIWQDIRQELVINAAIDSLCWVVPENWARVMG